MLGVGALIGLFFASMSTYDFVMHLDRQVHDVHCSFVPGAGPGGGESGCQVTMVSSYSSLFRTSVWGGVPISLPAMAVFAFLLAFAVELTLTDRQDDVRSSGFAALATGVPALTSIIMAYISLAKLDAVCKMCIGIYFASALCLVGGVGLFIRAWRNQREQEPEPEGRGTETAPILLKKKAKPESADEPERPADPAWVSASGSDDDDESARAPSPKLEERPTPKPKPSPPSRRPSAVAWSYLAIAFGVGVLFVAVPMIGYVSAAPKHERFIGTCGALSQQDTSDLTIALDSNTGEPPVIEVLDPLCPACLGFERRLDATGLTARMNRKALLFPLDDTCNWMVDSAIHPGACVVSSAMMCAGDRGRDVLAWSFSHQQEIMKATKADPTAAQRMVLAKFPDLEKCISSPVTKAKLARSLRWAVSNKLPVMTPQLYVGKVKLCEEDVDLGLDYMLSRMLSAHKKGTLRATSTDGETSTPPPVAEPDRGPDTKTTTKKPTSKPATTKPGTDESNKLDYKKQLDEARKLDGAKPDNAKQPDETKPPDTAKTPDPVKKPVAPPAKPKSKAAAPDAPKPPAAKPTPKPTPPAGAAPKGGTP